MKDTLGVTIQPGDSVMITAWGGNVTLANVDELAAHDTVAATAAANATPMGEQAEVRPT